MTQLIQYVDEDGNPTGETEEKLAAHHAHTRRHLAFSVYLFRDDGAFLVTQRAHSKKVWPNVWTNSCCGHPAPGETFEQAIRRRVQDELGTEQIKDIKIVLPDYRYTTPPYDGIIENEFCPVFVARLHGDVSPNPEEVEAYRWLQWSDYTDWIAREPELFSYWCKDQLPLLLKNPVFQTKI